MGNSAHRHVSQMSALVGHSKGTLNILKDAANYLKKIALVEDCPIWTLLSCRSGDIANSAICLAYRLSFTQAALA